MLEGKVTYNRLRWCGHVSRMNKEDPEEGLKDESKMKTFKRKTKMNVETAG
jgi:hypothetical protein